MAITLRYTPVDTSGKTSELSYQEMNDNLKTFVYSGSFNSGTNTLDLHFLSGSTSHSIDLSGLGGTDSYITSASLVGTDLTFTGDGSAFNSTVDLSSLSTLPSAPLNSFQFNSGSTLGGSELYYLEVSSSVGLNTTTPEATLHVKAANNASASLLIETDSLGQQESGSARLDFRVADNENGYKKYAIIARNNGDGFGRGSLHFALDDTANPNNAELDDSHLTIQSDGKVLMPNINNTVQNTVIGYDADSGELTYYSTASFGSGGGTPIDTGSFYVSSTVAGNVITFTQGDGTTESITVDTGSGGGGSGTPGGINGQVQFNSNGSFEGDSGFKYDNVTNTVTIESINTNTPSLYIATTETTPTTGDVLGEIEGYSTHHSWSLGGVRWIADSTWTTDTATRLDLQTISDGAYNPSTKFRIGSDGELRAHEYGSGNITGTATQLLGVTSNGSVVETDLPNGTTPFDYVTIDANSTNSVALNSAATYLQINHTGNTLENVVIKADITALGASNGGILMVYVFLTPSNTNAEVMLKFQDFSGGVSTTDIDDTSANQPQVLWQTRRWVLVFAYPGNTANGELSLVSKTMN